MCGTWPVSAFKDKLKSKVPVLAPVSSRLSGLSPFLGDNDTETLNNILDCRWDLEEEEFRGLSTEGREFISKLLTKEKK